MAEGDRTCDVLILGAGPAGCTAALYAARSELETIMLSPGELTGMMSTAPLVANFPGQVEPVPGKEILERLREQALRAGAEHALEAATFVDFSGPQFMVAAGHTLYMPAAVVIATGAMAAKPAPGEAEFQGRGVCYCVACDGPLFSGREVLVVGEDEQAAEEALALAGIAKRVTLVTPTPALVFPEDLQQALRSRENVQIETGLRIQEIVGDAQVSGARFRDRDGGERVLEAPGVFLYLRGRAPATGFLHGALPGDEKGYLITDEQCQTSVPGVYAAGDVRSKPIRQNITAAAEGCTAALLAEKLVRKAEAVRADRGK